MQPKVRAKGTNVAQAADIVGNTQTTLVAAVRQWHTTKGGGRRARHYLQSSDLVEKGEKGKEKEEEGKRKEEEERWEEEEEGERAGK